jgi:RNA polymerase sigma factor (TIGR02999 family)
LDPNFDPGDITVLLQRWREGDQHALDQLMPLVYPRLKSIANALERQQFPEANLQATALVNEAFLRLVKQQKLGWEGREHFFSLAALAMRHILTDHARVSIAAKRGGKRKRVPLHPQLQWISINHEETLDLNTAMDELGQFDPRKVRVVELRYFLGCTAEETADVLGISKNTVDRESDVARAWLFRRLKGANASESPSS